MTLSNKTLGILSILAFAAFACGSSSNAFTPSQGPDCTALQICCNQFPQGLDGGVSEQSSCDDTATAWGAATTAAAAANVEADCASAEEQYKKDELCGASVADGGSD
jgi:hypothetical protein